MFEIIKNAEIPMNKHNAGREPLYPFAEMEIHDGFDAPRDMGKSKRGLDNRQNIIGTCARNYVKRHNPTAKFTVRLLNDEQVRCVRIA